MALRRDRAGALLKGFWFAHLGWMFDLEHTNREKYTPDLMADRDIRTVDRLFPLWLRDLAGRAGRCSAG